MFRFRQRLLPRAGSAAPRKRRLSLLAVLGLSCVYPTERGGDLTVVLDSIPALIEGEVFQLGARVVDATGDQVPGLPVVFETSNPLIAVVGSDGQLLASGSGVVEVTARALGVEGAAVGSQSIKIAGVLEIDSISPSIVRYGEPVDVYGSGLLPDSLFLAVVGGAEALVHGYQPFDPEEPHRFGLLRLWVGPPAPPISQVQVLGFNGLVTSPDSILVIPRDLYEPNDTVPWDFGPLDRVIANPALAFEPRPRSDSVGVDWYRFTQIGTGDRSFVIRSTQAGPDGFQVFVTNDIRWSSASFSFSFGPGAWSIGQQFNLCQKIAFAPLTFREDSIVVAFRNLPPGDYDVFTVYQRSGGYQMGIVDAYRSELPPDQAEENDICDLATPIPNTGQLRYNIDNPHDIDWFRSTLADTSVVTLNVLADDSTADLDLYVLGDFLPDSIQVRGAAQIGGVTDAVTLTLPPGSYFAVVVDFIGKPTDYTLQVSTATAAPGATVTPPVGTLFPSAPGASALNIEPLRIGSQR